MLCKRRCMCCHVPARRRPLRPSRMASWLLRRTCGVTTQASARVCAESNAAGLTRRTSRWECQRQSRGGAPCSVDLGDVSCIREARICHARAPHLGMLVVIMWGGPCKVSACRANFAEIGPKLVEIALFGRTPTDVGPTSTEFDRCLTIVGQIWPERPSIGKTWPTTINLGTPAAKIGQFWPDFAATFARCRPNSASGGRTMVALERPLINIA